MNKTTKLLIIAAGLTSAAVIGQAATAKDNWENLCQKCHGADGKGETNIGKKLHIKDYTDSKVQAGIKDEDIAKAITDGVKEGGRQKMKAFKDLTPDEVKDLVAYVRSLKA